MATDKYLFLEIVFDEYSNAIARFKNVTLEETTDHTLIVSDDNGFMISISNSSLETKEYIKDNIKISLKNGVELRFLKDLE